MSWRDIPGGDLWIGGWYVEVSAKKEDVDLSSMDFKWKGTPPYIYEKTDAGPKEVGLGPEIWKLTPEDEPLLGKKNGATRDCPPMVYIMQYLEALVSKGFQVTGSHSIVVENAGSNWIDNPSDKTIIFSWTLTK